MNISIKVNTKSVEDFLKSRIEIIKRDLPPLLNQAGKELKTNSIASIVSNTSINNNIVDEKIGITNATLGNPTTIVSYDNQPLPIESYQPVINIISPIRASVSVDFWMKGSGQKVLKRAFYNPTAGKYRKRLQDKKAYPISKIFGPSVANLFQYIEETLVKEEAENLINRIVDKIMED